MERQDQDRDGATVAQLKNDIDSGRTGSKTATADPGLSPLGTDDEAAGHPASPETIAMARAEEQAIGTLATAADRPSHNGSILILVGVIAIIAIGAVIAFFVLR